MPAITALSMLLAQMSPRLWDEEYVFCTPTGRVAHEHSALAWAMVVEDEGPTLVLERRDADAGRLTYESVFRRITLEVHSSLEAVGFLAAVAGALAEQRIAVNAIAGARHDHLLIPADRAEDAMRILRDLQGTWRERTARRTTE